MSKHKITYISLTSLMVLSIILVAFFTYKDILNYYFNHEDTTYNLFNWEIKTLRDIVGIFKEPWVTGFYRPITALSFGIDYSIWGLNPFGHYLTNLILHILVSVFVFFLILSLAKGELFIAWLSAIIFTTHPIHTNVVPVIVYRQDLIPALFMLLSLLFFLKHISTVPAKRGYLILSLFFCALALGSKEIAIITPFVIFSYMIIFSNEKSFKEKILKALRVCLPYFLIVFFYFVWRTYLLHGIGGYSQHVDKSIFLAQTSKNYFNALLDPSQLSYFRSRHVALLIFFAFLFYRQEIKNSFTNSIHGKLVVFLLIWMFLPLGVYLLTLGPWNIYRLLYIPAIPFSGVLSVVFVKCFQSTIKKIVEKMPLALIKSLVVFIAVISLMFSFLAYSPLIKNYREWENAGKICQIVLNKLLEIVPKLPTDTTIYINNLPARVYPLGVTPTREGWCFADFNYKAFLNFYYPNTRVKLIPYYTVWNVYTDHLIDVDSEIKFKIKDERDKKVLELNIEIISDNITILQ